MEKKHKTYILLGAVLIVWGIIGFQIINYLSPTEEEIPVVTYEEYKSEIKKERELYSVKIRDRDPFLGEIITKPKHIITVKKKKEPVVFPKILYNGIVESGQNKAYIITINDKQEIVKINQVINGIKLLKGTSKEITFLYKGEKKIVNIKK